MRHVSASLGSITSSVIAAAFLALLGACGGGGDDGLESLAAAEAGARAASAPNNGATDLSAVGVAVINDKGLRAESCEKYAYTDLGTLGGTNSSALDINNAGQVVGSSQITDDAAYHATLWSGGTVKDLGTLGGTSSSASGINNAGKIIGNSQTAGDAGSHATLWSKGAMTDLGAFAASDINEAGLVVGGIAVGFLQTRAVLWNGTTLTELRPIDGPSGWISSAAAAINNAGLIAGTSSTIYYDDKAATSWTNGNPMQLGGFTDSFGYGVNNGGRIVGTTGSNPGSLGQAAVWNGTTLTILGGLSADERGHFPGAGLDINNAGQIVGRSATSDCCDWHAVLWNGATVVDLNVFLDESTASAGWVLTDAYGINDKGWIVGVAHNSRTFQSHAYLLSTSPVPSGNRSGKGRFERNVVCGLSR